MVHQRETEFSFNVKGEEPFSFGYGGTGKKSVDCKFDNFGEKFGENDVIGCYIVSLHSHYQLHHTLMYFNCFCEINFTLFNCLVIIIFRILTVVMRWKWDTPRTVFGWV